MKDDFPFTARDKKFERSPEDKELKVGDRVHLKPSDAEAAEIIVQIFAVEDPGIFHGLVLDFNGNASSFKRVFNEGDFVRFTEAHAQYITRA